MKNEKTRKAIMRAGLRYWEVAQAAGISPYTLSIWLRRELTGKRLERVEAAIAFLSKREGCE